MLHHINISDAYAFLLEYAEKQENSSVYFSYLRGLFMHYVLDRNCHPYIFYRTGLPSKEDNSKETQEKYMNLHVGFEGILDKIYADRNKTFKNPSKCAKCPDYQVKMISKMFYELAKYLKYGDIDEFTYYNAYKDLLFAETFLYSPLGFKKFLVHNVFSKGSYIDNMMSPKNTKAYEKYDILNLKQKDWYDCVTGEQRDESFLLLVSSAKREIEIIDDIICKAKNGENIRKDLMKFINNIDHDGFAVGAKKVHYQVYSDLKDCK